jgi:hypothetical protein
VQSVAVFFQLPHLHACLPMIRNFPFFSQGTSRVRCAQRAIGNVFLCSTYIYIVLPFPR